VLYEALAILHQRGWTQGITRNPATGEVDLLGAVAIAAGAPIGAVTEQPDLLQSVVPQAMRPAAYVAWEALEWSVGDDPLLWQDQTGRTFKEVASALVRAANRLEIAIRP
jgi:hypothetical protein